VESADRELSQVEQRRNGLDVAGLVELRDGLRLWSGARAPRAGWRKYACVLHGVKAWWRHAGSEPSQQRQWVHLHRQGSVGERALEGDAYQAFGPVRDALVGDGWS